VEYKDLTVVLPGDRHLVQDQFKPYSGSWKFGGTGLQQKGQDQPALALAKAPKELEEALAVVKSENEHRKENLASNASALNYTVHVKARKLSGDEGFLVLVRAQDDHNFLWFNIGGWGNTSVAAEKESAGGRAVISRQKPFHVETGRWYDIQIDCRAEDISLLIDGVLVQQVKDRSVPRIAADAGIDSQHQQLVVKIVNGDSQDRRFDLRLPFPIANRLVSVQTLRARQDPGSANSLMTLENSFGDPHRIAIYGSKAKVEKGLLKLSSQRGSVSVVRIPLR
jgi:alpha-L-arabinofuranosidase